MASLPDHVLKLATSADPADRLRALPLIEEGIEAGEASAEYLKLARVLVADPDNDCRWQAMSIFGGMVEANPEVVWDVICEHGTSTDEDMREAVATVLLEHLLQYHFDAYFPKLSQRINAGESLLADTLSRCWLFGQAEHHESEVKELASRKKE